MKLLLDGEQWEYTCTSERFDFLLIYIYIFKNISSLKGANNVVKIHPVSEVSL